MAIARHASCNIPAADVDNIMDRSSRSRSMMDCKQLGICMSTLPMSRHVTRELLSPNDGCFLLSTNE